MEWIALRARFSQVVGGSGLTDFYYMCVTFFSCIFLNMLFASIISMFNFFLKKARIVNPKLMEIFMTHSEIYTPVSVLSLIDIGKLAESYRRKSLGGTEKQRDPIDANIYYSFKPAWQTWKKESSCFLLKVNVSVFLQRKFSGTRFLWFHVYETPYGIKAACCENPRIRFGLASSKFLAIEFEEHSKANSLLPIVPMSRSQVEMAFE